MNQLILTANECYKAGRKIVPKGVMVHSTGANNPKISRYVAEVGTPGNHWNQGNIWKCVHGFLGYNDHGVVDFVQTLPWDHRGWHAGDAANNTHISFEICEDDLQNSDYFIKTLALAISVTAKLCVEFDLDPLAPGVVINHAEGRQLGIASNHADTGHWWSMYRYTMDNFRNDVVEEINYMKQAEFNERMAVWQEEQNIMPPSSWSSEARVWAEMEGLLTGNQYGEMQYKRPCTREELVQILWKFLKSDSSFSCPDI